jgi:periplasmic copper chaperone A
MSSRLSPMVPKIIATLGVLCAFTPVLAIPASASTKGTVTVTHAMIPVPTNSTTAAAYMTIHNGTRHPVSIVGASTPVSIAGSAMPMKEVSHGGSETMVAVPRITVAPNKTFVLAPGNYHVMLDQLKSPFKRGAKIPLTLQLSNGTSVSVTATVVPLSVAFGNGAAAPSTSNTGGMKGMKGMG